MAVGMELSPSIRRVQEQLSSWFQKDTFVKAHPMSIATTASCVPSTGVSGMNRQSENVGSAAITIELWFGEQTRYQSLRQLLSWSAVSSNSENVIIEDVVIALRECCVKSQIDEQDYCSSNHLIETSIAVLIHWACSYSAISPAAFIFDSKVFSRIVLHSISEAIAFTTPIAFLDSMWRSS